MYFRFEDKQSSRAKIIQPKDTTENVIFCGCLSEVSCATDVATSRVQKAFDVHGHQVSLVPLCF